MRGDLRCLGCASVCAKNKRHNWNLAAAGCTPRSLILADRLTTVSARTFYQRDNMRDTKFKEALKLFEQAQPAPTLTEYQREQQAIRANYERAQGRTSGA